MNRKTNIINQIISILIPFIIFFIALFICKKNYNYNILTIMLFCILGVICFSLINILFHELGHVIFGKINKFELINFTFLFFSFTKNNSSTNLTFNINIDCAGSTQMICKTTEKIDKKLYNMTFGGVAFNFILMLVSIVPLFLYKYISMNLFAFFSTFLPISTYCFLNNVLPIFHESARNDGGVMYGIKHNDDESKVIINISKIESELLNGKRPSEINEELYFSNPQLPENSLTYLSLLSAKFNYFLDKKDYEKANNICSRFISLYEYLPISFVKIVKTYLLYSYCTFNFNEEKADDLVNELEKYLNNTNDSFTVLTKLVYYYFVKKNYEIFDLFSKKILREAKKSKLKGMQPFYYDLVKNIKNFE